MEIKDWKNISKRSWVKKQHKPGMYGSGVIRLDKIPQAKGYLYFFRTSGNIYLPKKFDTEAKALKYVKDYMRRH